MSVFNQSKATQKSVESRAGGPEVLEFEAWLLKIRLPLFVKNGVKVGICEKDGIGYIRLTFPEQKPKIYTTDDFFEEYKDTYLASMGLNCQCPFEENVGVSI